MVWVTEYKVVPSLNQRQINSSAQQDMVLHFWRCYLKMRYQTAALTAHGH